VAKRRGRPPAAPIFATAAPRYPRQAIRKEVWRSCSFSRFSVMLTEHYRRLPADYLCELELKLIQTQMAQKPMLREEVYARVLRASKNVK
jgi:hypothetical protein